MEELETIIRTEDGVRVSVCEWDDGGVFLHLTMRSGTSYATIDRANAQRLLEGLQAILAKEVAA